MDVVVNGRDLGRALKLLAPVAANKSSLAVIAGNVALEAGGGVLTLSAMDLERRAVVEVGATVNASGHWVGNLKALLASASEEIHLMGDGPTGLRVLSGVGEAALEGELWDDWPGWVERKWQPLFTVGELELAAALGQVDYAIPTRDLRKVLFGVFFNKGVKEPLHLVATDGTIMGMRECASAEGGKVEVIVPGTSCEWVRRAIKALPSGERVEVHIHGDKNATYSAFCQAVRFRCSSWEIVVNLIYGTYPNWRAVVPSKWDAEVTVLTRDLEAAVKAADKFAGDDYNRIVRFRHDGGDFLNLSVLAEGKTVFSRSVPASSTSPFTVWFNARKVGGTLASIPDDAVRVEVNERGPCVSRCRGGFGLIMPFGISKVKEEDKDQGGVGQEEESHEDDAPGGD